MKETFTLTVTARIAHPLLSLSCRGSTTCCGDLVHQVIGLPGVQDAGESAHLAVYPLLILALPLHLNRVELSQ